MSSVNEDRKMKQTRSTLLSYAVAIVSVALATVLRLMLAPVLQAQAPFVTYIIAVALIAWYAGFGPALVAASLGAITGGYFFVTGPLEVMKFVPFLVLSVVISLISETMRRTRARAEANALAFSESRNLLSITLASIGDAVITTDEKGRVTFINPVAEKLTGWTEIDARGKALEEVFNIVHDQTREKVESPVLKAQRSDAGVRLAANTQLIKKDGSEIPIEDSVAPIKDERGKLIGVVLVFCDITERKQAEAESKKLLSQIEQERARVNQIVANVPSIVWEAWGKPDEATQRIDFVSSHVEKMLGYSVQEWLSTPNFWLSIVHPDDKELAAEEAAAIFASCKGGTSQFRWMTKDGRAICVEAQSNVICDEQNNPIGMRGVTMDITERLRSAEAKSFLAEASNALASSLDYETTLASVVRLSVPYLADWCLVHILDESGQVKPLAVAHTDPAKAEEAKELESRYPQNPNAQLGPPNVLRTGKSEFYPEISDTLLAEYANDKNHLDNLRQRRMKSAMVVPMLARNRTLGVISFVTAETKRQYTEADLALAEDLAHRAAFAVDNAVLYRDAQRAITRAEEANRLKDEFLATVSHELRTPLNAIIGWAHLLRTKKFDDATSARAMETIERNAKSQARIVEDILDVSRAITGKLRLEVQPVLLGSVIESALDAIRPAAEAKEIRLQDILDPRAGPVSGDPNRLQQIVWNLLSNAVKFTPKGGRVVVRLERVNSQVEIIVSDTGQGIHPELLPFIFDRFRQGDSTTTRQHGGLGLGLAIVRHLVELHGGSVQADSPGHGSGANFTVNLPLMAIYSEHRNADRAPHADSNLPPPQEAPQLSGIKVMVVDDEPDTCEVLKIMIEQYGGEVKTCASSAEAIETLKHWKPDVLVSDIEMPGEDGYHLIEKIRSLAPEQGGNVPALALTAYARVDDRMRALSAGYQMHLAKPAEPMELTTVITSLAARNSKRLGS
ncbi:MAG TPA: PAS domain S-box protein [Blastocatellia bacterium]|nr:PAS domain S-box protein [Blastocatellia bacterium]